MEVLEQLKGYLFERAARRTPCLKLCGTATGWDDSYTFNRYDDVREVCFWANSGKNTIMAAKKLPKMSGYLYYMLSVKRACSNRIVYRSTHIELEQAQRLMGALIYEGQGNARAVAVEMVGFKTGDHHEPGVLLDAWECPEWQRAQVSCNRLQAQAA